jgi:hypothetical protein
MTTPPFPGGTFARSVGGSFGHAADRVRSGCRTAAARRSVRNRRSRGIRPVGQVFLPLLPGEAQSGDLARPGEPVRRIDVPDPPRAGVGDHHDVAAVRGEQCCSIPAGHGTRERVADRRPGPHIPQQHVAGRVRAHGGAPVGREVDRVDGAPEAGQRTAPRLSGHQVPQTDGAGLDAGHEGPAIGRGVGRQNPRSVGVHSLHDPLRGRVPSGVKSTASTVRAVRNRSAGWFGVPGLQT